MIVKVYRALRVRSRRALRHLYMAVCAYGDPILRFYLRHFMVLEDNRRDRALDAYSRSRADFVVLQVGANDGFSRDPVHRFIVRDRWRGVLVEPQPDVFERELRQTYRAHPQLNLINAAVDRVIGEKELYRLSFCNERWANGLSGFCCETLEKQVKGYVQGRCERDGIQPPERLEDCISSLRVPAVTFETLLDRYGLSRLDLLQIDCEGYDAELIKMFPFERLVPHFINFESLHLSPAQKAELKETLGKLGYICHEIGHDTFCELPASFPV
jgi:FkbM family methyltransferase